LAAPGHITVSNAILLSSEKEGKRFREAEEETKKREGLGGKGESQRRGAPGVLFFSGRNTGLAFNGNRGSYIKCQEGTSSKKERKQRGKERAKKRSST